MRTQGRLVELSALGVEGNHMIRLRVKEVAKSLGVSQGKLQRRADLDIKTIRKIYKEPYTIINTDTLDKIAKALGVNASELLESVPDEPHRPAE